MKKKVLHSFEELGPCRRKITGDTSKRRRKPNFEHHGIPVKESIEYRILMKKREIMAMDAEWELTHPKPIALKQAIAITLFGVTKYYRIEDKEAIIASKFGYTIVEVEENTQIIRFGF
jgi:hypothetical protein